MVTTTAAFTFTMQDLHELSQEGIIEFFSGAYLIFLAA